MYTESEFTNDSDFRHRVNHDIEELLDQLDDLELDDFDSRVTPGSLVITFEDGSVFMLSQQTATHELWLSANYTAWHFISRESVWIERDSKDDMLQVLSQLFSQKLGIEITLTP